MLPGISLRRLSAIVAVLPDLFRSGLACGAAMADPMRLPASRVEVVSGPGEQGQPGAGRRRVILLAVKFGIQIPSFTWPGGAEAIGPTLARIARQADDIGVDSIWVMDHFFQIRGVGPAEDPMLEGWTTLGFLAAQTTKARLGLMVGGVHYRLPGPLGEGRDDARRPVGRSGLARDRRRLERGRVAEPRLPLPAARRPLRDARGDAPDRPRDVDRRAGHGGARSTAASTTRRG